MGHLMGHSMGHGSGTREAVRDPGNSAHGEAESRHTTWGPASRGHGWPFSSLSRSASATAHSLHVPTQPAGQAVCRPQQDALLLAVGSTGVAPTSPDPSAAAAASSPAVAASVAAAAAAASGGGGGRVPTPPGKPPRQPPPEGVPPAASTGGSDPSSAAAGDGGEGGGAGGGAGGDEGGDEGDEMTFEITVPDGVEPGQRLQATTPGGQKVKLVVPVPEGAKPGMLLTFPVPRAAASRARSDDLRGVDLRGDRRRFSSILRATKSLAHLRPPWTATRAADQEKNVAQDGSPVRSRQAASRTAESEDADFLVRLIEDSCTR